MRSHLLTILFLLATPLGATTLIGSLPQPASNPTATLLADGRVLIAGGYSTQRLNNAVIYDPATRTLTPLAASMNSGHAQGSSILLRDGRVMITGGSPAAVAVEIFDPATGLFTVNSPPQSAHDYAPLVMLPDGRVLLAGGTDDTGNPTSIAEIFDPVASTWSADGNLAEPRFAQAAVLLPDGKVLMAGGLGATSDPDSEIFDPVAKTSVVLPGKVFSQPIGVGLANGRVIIINTVTVSVFDESAQSFNIIKYSLPTSGQAVVLLHDVKLLLAGGVDSITGAPVSAVYVFDPEDSSLTEVDTLQVARRETAPVVLNDGSVLLAGGYTATAAAATVDLYTGTPRHRAAPPR